MAMTRYGEMFSRVLAGERLGAGECLFTAKLDDYRDVQGRIVAGGFFCVKCRANFALKWWPAEVECLKCGVVETVPPGQVLSYGMTGKI